MWDTQTWIKKENKRNKQNWRGLHIHVMEKAHNPSNSFLLALLFSSAQPWAASWVVTGCNFWHVKKRGLNLLDRQGWASLERFQSLLPATSPTSAWARRGCSGQRGGLLEVELPCPRVWQHCSPRAVAAQELPARTAVSPAATAVLVWRVKVHCGRKGFAF